MGKFSIHPKALPQRLINPQSSGMTSRCGWRTLSVPIQIRASPCSIHGTAINDERRFFFALAGDLTRLASAMLLLVVTTAMLMLDVTYFE